MSDRAEMMVRLPVDSRTMPAALIGSDSAAAAKTMQVGRRSGNSERAPDRRACHPVVRAWRLACQPVRPGAGGSRWRPAGKNHPFLAISILTDHNRHRALEQNGRAGQLMGLRAYASGSAYTSSTSMSVCSILFSNRANSPTCGG